MIFYYEGTQGQPGGQGGQNGCGGEGGKKGDASITNANGGETFPIRVTAQNGLGGGKPGNTGQYGKEGWDVGITKRGVYIKSLYNGSGSYCYATIKPRTRERQMLQDHEKTRQRKTDAERKGDAIARKSTAINTEAIEQRYSKATETKMEEEAQAEAESEAQLNRLAIRIDVPKEAEYKEMEPVKIKTLTEVSNINEEELYKNFVDWNLLKTMASSASVPSKLLEVKMIISRLRYEQSFKQCSKGEFAKCIHKYLKSKKTEETTEVQMFNIAKMAKKVQKLELHGINCSKYMRAFDADLNGYSACTEILFNEKRCKDVLSSTIQECNEKLLSFKDYNHVENAWKEWSEKVFIQKKLLGKHRLELENAFDAIKQNYQNDKAVAELKALIAGAASKEENKKLEEIEKLENTNIEFIIKASKAEFPKSLKFIGAKLLFAFIQGRLLTEANKASASAAGRSMIAYETKTNIRIYFNQIMIENHYPKANIVHHIALDPSTGNLQLLTFNIMHVELCDNREVSGNQFQQRLTRYIERDSGIKGADMIENIDKVPENEETLRQALV
uniref:HNH endonuclease n=1 Tax=Panagrolaimus sp. PS1159 TaxID=55785 RepID=A0AC35G5L4_9BILA